MKSKTKIVFLIGGVLSGIGKGTTNSAFAHIFKYAGLKVSCMKHDPYLNWNAGKIDAEEHGEVFVTTNGHLTDLDLGSYERFLQQNMPNSSSTTLGETLHDLIHAEKIGLYNGKTIDLTEIPLQLEKHIEKIIKTDQPDVLFIEVGGNVADKNVSFILETIVAMKRKYPVNSIATIFLTYLIYFEKSNEFKARAASHSIKKLRSHLIDPDLVIFRIHKNKHVDKKELAAKCQINPEQVFILEDVENIFQLPRIINQKKACHFLFKNLDLIKSDFEKTITKHFQKWNKIVEHIVQINATPPVAKIAICHQYPKFAVNYGSQRYAFEFSSHFLSKNFELISINPKILVDDLKEQAKLKECDGIFISTGFHEAGFEGKIFAANYARKHKIPLLATGFGMLATLVGYAREVFQMKIDLIPNERKKLLGEISPIIEFIDPYHQREKHFTGTKPMIFHTQLPFAKKCKNFQESKNQEQIFEGRFNTWLKPTKKIIERCQQSDFQPVMFTNDKLKIASMFELANHPFFIAVADHHEFSAWPTRPSFLYTEFLRACIATKKV